MRLAGAVAATGSSLVLAADSIAIARHAAALGLIAPDAVAAVADEHAGSDAPPPRSETVRLVPGLGEDGDTLAPKVIAAFSDEEEVPTTVVVSPAETPLTRV